MPLKAGVAAPSFSGTLSDGSAWSSEARRGKPLVVYFYPKDFTSGCTKEACAFRDIYDVLRRDFDAEILGVSRDDVESHARFKAEHRLPFPLLADPAGTVSELFGVNRFWGLIPFVKRVTFVIDRDGLIRGVFHHELAIGRHVQDVRDCLASLGN